MLLVPRALIEKIDAEPTVLSLSILAEEILDARTFGWPNEELLLEVRFIWVSYSKTQVTFLVLKEPSEEAC